MFKVLQICNKAPFPANDGSSIAIYNMARGLIENKVDLTLLTINTKKHFKPDSGIPEDFKIKSNYISIYRNTNTGIWGAFFNLFSSQSYFVSRFYFKKFENRLIELLQTQQFDIIQLEGLFMAVYINTIKKHSKAKITLRAHNVEHFIWDRHIQNETSWIKSAYLSLQNKRLKHFEIKVLQNVDAVIPITETDGEVFKKIGCKKPVFSCITGVDVETYQSPVQVSEKAKTLFYFGSMDWLPNQEAVTWFLNNCWKTIHAEVPEARFIIAGRGMPLDFFHITLPNVLIVENVENGKNFFKQHQLMVVPLLSGSGLRIKIIEGMAYGKAIVSTNIGAEGIDYTNQQNIIIADSPKEFSQAVIRLLNNDEERLKLQTHAAQFAKENFNNGKVVSKLIQFYTHLLND